MTRIPTAAPTQLSRQRPRPAGHYSPSTIHPRHECLFTGCTAHTSSVLPPTIARSLVSPMFSRRYSGSPHSPLEDFHPGHSDQNRSAQATDPPLMICFPSPPFASLPWAWDVPPSHDTYITTTTSAVGRTIRSVGHNRRSTLGTFDASAW